MAVLNPRPLAPKRAQGIQQQVPKGPTLRPRTAPPEGAAWTQPKRTVMPTHAPPTAGRQQQTNTAMRVRRAALARIAAGHRAALMSQAKQGG